MKTRLPRKALSLFLSLVMMLSLLPTMALAAEDENVKTVTGTVTKKVVENDCTLNFDNCSIQNLYIGGEQQFVDDTCTTNVIIRGNGAVTSSLWVEAGATLTIEGGSYNNNRGTYYPRLRLFSAYDGQTGDFIADSNSKLIVKGGFFKTNEVGLNYEMDEWKYVPLADYVADDYKLIAINEGEDGYADGYRYKVVPDVTYVAQIGETKYETLQAAVSAAQDGDTIVLLDNFAEGTINANTKTFTLDLNGKTWTASQRIAMFGAWANFTLEDSVGTGVITNEGTTENSKETDPSGLLDFGTFSTATYRGGKLVTKGRNLAAVNGLVGSTARFEGTCVETDSGLRGPDLGYGALSITVTAGTFNVDPSAYVPATGYTVTDNNNGTWTVAAKAPAVTYVAKIGAQGYDSLDAAILAAETGEVVEILQDCEYKMPEEISKITTNITIKAVDGVNAVFDCTGSGNVCAIPNGVTIENVTMNFGKNSYHGAQHAGTINMVNCTLNGLFYSYSDMNFTGCMFNAPGTTESGVSGTDYSMWIYAGNVSFDGCTFNGAGKFFNVYNEGNAREDTDGKLIPWEVTVKDCVAISSTSNKAVFNVKETCTNGKNLTYDVDFSGTNVAVGSFPVSSDSENLTVLNAFVQVDDKRVGGTDDGREITIKAEEGAKLAKIASVSDYKEAVAQGKEAVQTLVNNNIIANAAFDYETPAVKTAVAKIGETKYETLAAAIAAANTAKTATIQLIDDSNI